MLFKSVGELIPLYALYALLFAEHGMGMGQISALFAIWSTTSFLLEVPSGAWADTVSRRGLLVLSGVLLTLGFTLWTVAPSFGGFAAGFVLWGAAGALASGTFEALLYDTLVVRGESAAYPRILGYTRAGAEAAVVIAIVVATPLYLFGGYALVCWSSVAIAALHAALALSLPTAPKALSAEAVADLPEAETVAPLPEDTEDEKQHGIIAVLPLEHAGSPIMVQPERLIVQQRPVMRYLGMLRAGVAEAIRIRTVRYGVLLTSLLFGITAFDEYFALLALEARISTAVVPLLVGLTVLGSLIGSVSAGRTESMSGRTMAIAIAVAGVLFLVGALISGSAAHRPHVGYLLVCLGFTAIGISYGIVHNTLVVAEARLQDAITGPARATVTSVSGLLSELVSLVVFGFAALVTIWWPISTLLALLGVAVLMLAAPTSRWLPAGRHSDA
ncbi:MFS transporter [Nocardia sp. 004]|uniref:MFS transporter n=1 Tax=Nocardia sp. 004 TaxID=3385978 RepID=UPI00399FEB0C